MITNEYISPGDAVFARTRGVYGFVIRFGQALRWWKSHRWNHMAIVDSIDKDGNVWVIQMARKGQRVKISDVAPGGTLKILPMPEDLNLDNVLEFARKQIGTDYGVLTIISIAINLCLPQFLNLDIRRAKTLICSALVARAWEHGGWDCPVDPFQITPAEFSELFNNNGYIFQKGL